MSTPARGAAATTKPSPSASAPAASAPAGAWLPLVVFVAGAALMAYEIVGSRLLAPYFGNSTFVWGSLISVFLGALAAGYAIGGRIADRHPSSGALASILAISAVLVGISVLVAEPLQEAVIDLGLGVRLNPLVSAVLLFGPASVLIGMVSPYAVRLRAESVESLGRTAGSLYGLSTAGSIVGTLAASFWLVQDLGSEATVTTVAVALVGCALLAAFAGRAAMPARGLGVATAIGIGILVAIGTGADEIGDQVSSAGSGYSPVFHAGGYQPEFEPNDDGTLRAKADSSYHRIRVVDYEAGVMDDEQPARVLHFDNSLQAAAVLKGGSPVVTGPPMFGYLRAFDLVPALKPDAQRVLLIGLGSGAAAMRLHELRPQLRIDVVELDPKVVELAREWFGYRDAENGNDRITTHVGDGRFWLAAQGDAEFDAIVLDTYFADSIPFHLTTREFLELVRERLADDGIAAANLIGAIEGDGSKLLRAMHRTWAEVFDDVVLYPVRDGSRELDLTHFANVELFAASSRGVLPARGGEASLVREGGFPQRAGTVLDADLERLIEDRYVGELEHEDVPVLTDDKAPVDSLMQVDGL